MDHLLPEIHIPCQLVLGPANNVFGGVIRQNTVPHVSAEMLVVETESRMVTAEETHGLVRAHA